MEKKLKKIKKGDMSELKSLELKDNIREKNGMAVFVAVVAGEGSLDF